MARVLARSILLLFAAAAWLAIWLGVFAARAPAEVNGRNPDDPGLRAFRSAADIAATVATALVVIPAMVLWEALAPRRPKLPQNWRFCRHCRYDLIGNESGVCPECGTMKAA